MENPNLLSYSFSTSCQHLHSSPVKLLFMQSTQRLQLIGRGWEFTLKSPGSWAYIHYWGDRYSTQWWTFCQSRRDHIGISCQHVFLPSLKKKEIKKRLCFFLLVANGNRVDAVHQCQVAEDLGPQSSGGLLSLCCLYSQQQHKLLPELSPS